MNAIYAVVDMETTSTNKEIGKIIQFSCTFIKNKKIETTFNTYINPLVSIDETIQQLTGITNDCVKDAPIFSDIAPYIYSLLQGCVFVAHNVNFDYEFLSFAFEKEGLPPLQLQAIDTVELSQCLLPTMESYRLSDLTKELNIEHEHPHQADSDSQATARLFLYLEEVIQQFPVPLLKQLLRFKSALSKNTGVWLEAQYKKRKQQSSYLPKEMTVISGIVLQRPSHPVASFAKETVNLRQHQKEMITWLQNQSTSPLFLEAETGSGKTLSYLMAYEDKISTDRPLIISTSTTLLQEQLLREQIPLLNRLTKKNHQACLLKSSHHYIDLTRFAQTLNDEEVPVVQRLKMRLLVWLAQTKTGDMSELNITLKQHPYWEKIRHRGLQYVPKKSPFYHVDYLHRREERRCDSDIYIMNHHYLLTHPFETDYLIIDEAHQWPKVWRDQKESQLHFSFFNQIKKQLLQPELLLFSKTNQKQWGRLSEQLVYAFEMLAQQAKVLKEALQQQITAQDTIVVYQPMMLLDDCEEIAAFLTLLKETQSLITKACDLLKYSENKKTVWQYWQTQLQVVSKTIQAFHDFFASYPDDLNEIQVEKNYLFLRHLPYPIAKMNESEQFNHVKQILFISGTLLFNGKPSLFQPVISLEKAKIYKQAPVFDYGKQAKLYVLTDSCEEFYQGEALSELLIDLYKVKPKIACLMTSNDRLSLVKEQLKKAFPVFTMTPNGNKQKVLRQFNESQTGILLGTTSLWEGSDLVDVSCLVIEKLPFMSPVSHDYHCLEKEPTFSFEKEVLQEMMVHLRQGMGRLLRNHEHHGEMIVTDQRFVTQSYASILHSYLPKGLEVQAMNKEKLLTTIRKDIFN